MIKHIWAGLAALSVLAASSAAPAEEAASRIVSIGGDVTEIIYALGAGERIVAVDTTSTFPVSALNEKKSVGYMRALSAEGVLSLTPDLIIASEGAGPPEAVRALKAASVPFHEVPDTDTADGVLSKILAVGASLGRDDDARKLADEVRSKFARLAAKREALGRKVKTLFVLNASADRIIVGGSGTSADAALRLAGAGNAAGELEGFKPITAEGLVSMAPEAIVVMTGGRGGDDAEALGQRPAVKLTPAGRSGRILDMEGSYLLGFGPRAPEALGQLMDWLSQTDGDRGKS